MTDSKKRELLFRKAQGKARLADYLNKIADLHPDITNDHQLLSLEESDLLLASFSDKGSAVIAHEVELSPAKTIEMLDEALHWMNGPYYMLIDTDWKYCGAVKIPATRPFNRNFKFLTRIFNDIIFISEDRKRLFHIDYWEYGATTYIDITRREQRLNE